MKLGNVELENNKTHIVAILNLTPDSFYDGGRFFCNGEIDTDKVLYAVGEMVRDGAAIIDIGGESTRPGFKPIVEEQELDRIIPAISAIKQNYDIPISVDTYKPDTARVVIEEKVDIINDIGFLSNNMLEIIRDNDVGYILMHNRFINIPSRSKATISMDELNLQINEKLVCLKEYGFGNDKVIIDPGLGFGKSNEDDVMILKNISKLHVHNYNILLGASNKSVIDYVTPLDKNERLEGTLAITAHAFYNNISFVRVHDVKSNARLLNMLEAMKG